MTKRLVMTIGLPRSGKTTWARQQGVPIVCPDAIRFALHGERFIGLAEPFVWAIAKCMVRALFLAGHPTVILDATNTTVKRREEWRSKEWARAFKFVPTSREECIARAEREGDTYIIPIIEKMAAGQEGAGPLEDPWELVGDSLESDALASVGLNAEGGV